MHHLIQSLLLMIIVLLGIPAGLLIARYTEEELRAGKRWFRLIMAASAVIFVGSFLISDPDSRALIMTAAGFLFLLAYTSLRKAKA